MWKHFEVYRAIILMLLTCLVITIFTRLDIWYVIGAALGAFVSGCLRAYEKYKRAKNVKD